MSGTRPPIHLSHQCGKCVFSKEIMDFRVVFPGIKRMDVHGDELWIEIVEFEAFRQKFLSF